MNNEINSNSKKGDLRMHYEQVEINGKIFCLVPIEDVGRPKKLDTRNKELLKTLLIQKQTTTCRKMAESYGVSESTMARALREARKVCQG